MRGFDWQGRGDPGSRGLEANSLFLRLQVDGLTQLGVDLETLLLAWDVPMSGLECMPDRVARAWSDRFWVVAEELSGDPFIGVRLAHLVRSGLDDLVGTIARRSGTLGDALGYLSRYGRVLDAALDMRVEYERDMAIIVQQPSPGPRPPRQATEYVVVTLALIGRQLTCVPVHACDVHFRHRAPRELATLRAHLGPHLHFDGMYNALILDRELLDLPIMEQDAATVLRLRKEADELLRGLPDDRFLQRVREAVEDLLERGAPGAREVAERLSLREATLRTRLRLRGTSLRLLIDSVRRRLAMRYLQTRQMSVPEVALRLGYQDPATFGRAFRRWVGCSPSEYVTTH
ncbi:MAG: AraC family transcriptional regulator ligand-binding domain-containing protein [Myxococcales bacterium]|nr:AraC family transcriptional regulator ligand-binding domain-containing protein [Myxococcales bacterium]MDD9965167.1 AraC family transcriptional regulator ligand-binding domain-containing protein [Myxococcales bacterium]